ncbi:MAG: hypothetical protein JRH19_24625 [Deltaproteobacteria bacterium]|nr:hypothetical protein [Deltaproteobacteria bacterium]
MTCKRHFAGSLLCLGLLLPTLGSSRADEPVASETAAVNSCDASPSDSLPRVRSRSAPGKRTTTLPARRDVVVLNTRGYGYHVPHREPAEAPVPAKRP